MTKKKSFLSISFCCLFLEVFARRPKHDLYENPVGTIMLSVIFLFIGIVVVYFIYDKYKRSINKNDFFSYKNIKPYLLVCILLFSSYVIVNFIIPSPEFESSKDKVKYGKRHGYPKYEEEGYRELTNMYVNSEFERTFFQREYKDLNNVSKNTDHHKGYIQSFFKNHIYEVEAGQLLIDYEKISDKNIRNFGDGVLYYEINSYNQAIESFDSVPNQKLKNLNYFLGKISFNSYEYDKGVKYFNIEIKNKGNIKASYSELIKYYYSIKDWNKINEFYNDEKIKEFMPFYVKDHLLYKNGDFISLSKLYFGHYIKKFNVLGSFAALLVALVWLFYLIRLDFFKRSKYGSIIATFILSASLPFLVWYISSFINYTLNFDLSGGLFNDLLYCIFSIGLVEEIFKIIPFLIVLKFSSSIKQPYDYILYACVSALGFAFIENTLYYTQDKLDIVHSRALVSVFSHMFDSTLVAYGLILAKYKFNKKPLPYLIGFLLLAALVHGLYDFFLINETARELYLITFLIYLISIHVWADIRSIALNQSEHFSYSLISKANGLQFFLVLSLLGILMFEYLIMGVKFGGEAANEKLIEAFLSGSYFIIYLSLSLGRVDLIKSYWKPITLPARMAHYLAPRMVNPKNYLGVKVVISSDKYNKKLKSALPKTGEIIDRKVLGKDENWFEVSLNEPLIVKNKEVKSIIIKFYNSDANPYDHKNLRILVRLSKSDESYNGLVLDRKEFVLMGWAYLNKTND